MPGLAGKFPIAWCLKILWLPLAPLNLSVLYRGCFVVQTIIRPIGPGLKRLGN